MKAREKGRKPSPGVEWPSHLERFFQSGISLPGSNTELSLLPIAVKGPPSSLPHFCCFQIILEP